MMLMGWGILAVPTGIVTAEMAAQRRFQLSAAPTTRTCHECLTEGHAAEANFCFNCGVRLPPYQQQQGAAPKAGPPEHFP
jgi:voltage-gated potassium channel